MHPQHFAAMRDWAKDAYEQAKKFRREEEDDSRRQWIAFDVALAIVTPGYLPDDEAKPDIRALLERMS